MTHSTVVYMSQLFVSVSLQYIKHSHTHKLLQCGAVPTFTHLSHTFNTLLLWLVTEQGTYSVIDWLIDQSHISSSVQLLITFDHRVSAGRSDIKPSDGETVGLHHLLQLWDKLDQTGSQIKTDMRTVFSLTGNDIIIITKEALCCFWVP